ncbi:MAG: bifunctional (p)ppGpp synthetase/guanosine-3',5'-bis(diphosphate) 3'-pyrophosphohydrolase [Thiomargarita sp.]|nr:bifunctional (p)ppGpp synthetase/guanosine-3',5'-bis(diphosphate) 3'-pyrophosphohydrolase [Thiomargarita sp.]
MFNSNDMSLFLTALSFATEKHRAQRRKDCQATPYINHPIEVAETLWHIGKVRDIVTLVSALLHDTLEDTQTTPEEIQNLFGTDVLCVVQEVSDDKNLPKQVRKRKQIETAAHKSTRAQELKLADKICNVHDITRAPPKNWSLERRTEYIDWAEQVIAGVRGVNPSLESHFDTIAAEARHTLTHPTG